jgi:DNA-binding IclR family transcriptional regulator
MDNDNAQSLVQSISRAADILECLSNGINSVTDIANHCGCSKSTAHRLLQTLTKKSLAAQDPFSRKYYMGYLITRLIWKPEIAHQYLTICAEEEVNQLADITGETVTLGLLVGLRYVNLYSVPSKYDLRVVEAPQKPGHMHAGAPRKMVLAQLSNKELKLAMNYLKLQPATGQASIDKDELTAQIKKIRQQGYAVSSNELTIGAMSIAAPIKKYVCPAALSILGPESRMQPRIAEFLNYLISSATRISNNVEDAINKK